MSIEALRWAKRQITGSPTRKAVLMALADYADSAGRAWPSQAVIAADTEMSERSVRTAIHDLMAAGLLTRQERRRPDGTRGTDVLHLRIEDDNRKDVPPVRHRKQLPADVHQPANRVVSTGKSRHINRQIASKPPEAVAGQEPPRELPLNPHQKGSEATASGTPTEPDVPVPLTLTDRLWLDGKAALTGLGVTNREAGSIIGTGLKACRDPGRVLWACGEAAHARTGDPRAYVMRLISDAPEARARGRPPPTTRFSNQGTHEVLAEFMGYVDVQPHDGSPILDLGAEPDGPRHGGLDGGVREPTRREPERFSPQGHLRVVGSGWRRSVGA